MIIWGEKIWVCASIIMLILLALNTIPASIVLQRG
jgi:hypothetical protein